MHGEQTHRKAASLKTSVESSEVLERAGAGGVETELKRSAIRASGSRVTCVQVSGVKREIEARHEKSHQADAERRRGSNQGQKM